MKRTYFYLSVMSAFVIVSFFVTSYFVGIHGLLIEGAKAMVFAVWLYVVEACAVFSLILLCLGFVWLFSKKYDKFFWSGLAINAVLIAAIAFVLLAAPTDRTANLAHGADLVRLSDLHVVQQDLELYYQKCGHYPGVAESGTKCGAFQRISSWPELESAIMGSDLGLNDGFPIERDARWNYLYATDPDGQSYILGANLSLQDDPILNESAGGDWYGVTGCGKSLYCVLKSN